MRKYAGAGCLVLGIMLSGPDLESVEPMSSRMSRLFTGWTADGPMVIGGVVAVVAGGVLWVLAAKGAPKGK